MKKVIHLSMLLIALCCSCATAPPAQPNKQDTKQELFFLSVKNGNPDLLRASLEAGADVKARANNGETALAFASEAGHTEIVELLMKGGL